MSREPKTAHQSHSKFSRLTFRATGQTSEYRTKYEYDALGQVKADRKYWPDGSPVAGQQFEYSFDDIGNRTSTRAGGDQNGWNLRQADYTPNDLNQYSSRTG